MDKDLKELYELSEDILNASAIAYNFCRESGDEQVAKVRSIMELIHNKADKLCVRPLEMSDKYVEP